VILSAECGVRSAELEKNAEGFTLIEILVALAILGLAASVIYSSYSLTVEAIDDGMMMVEAHQIARGILGRMAREISSAYLSESDSTFTFVGEDDEEEGFPSDRLGFTAALYRLYPKDSRIGNLAGIEYRLGSATRDRERGRLFRRENFRVGQNLAGGEFAAELGERVRGIDFTYFDREGREFEEWNSQEKESGNKLPAAVKITLMIEQENGTLRLFSTMAEIALER